MPDRPPHSTDLVVNWNAVLKPGKPAPAGRPDPFPGLASMDLEDSGFSLTNARCLAAHSLLVYHDPEDGADPVTALPHDGRRSVLARFGWRECFHADLEETVCSIVEPTSEQRGVRPAVLVFRGTAHLNNWLTNIQSLPREWDGGGYVHSGFAEVLGEIWEQLAPELAAIAAAGRRLFITGHSLGAALATLALCKLRRSHRGVRAEAYTFGSPRVGNTDFSRSLEGAKLFRVVNNEDLVTRLPLPFTPSRRLSFLHAGDGYFLDASSVLHSRGSGDLDEESASLTKLKELALAVPAAFAESEPPGMIADHAPVCYIDHLRRAAESWRAG